MLQKQGLISFHSISGLLRKRKGRTAQAPRRSSFAAAKSKCDDKRCAHGRRADDWRSTSSPFETDQHVLLA